MSNRHHNEANMFRLLLTCLQWLFFPAWILLALILSVIYFTALIWLSIYMTFYGFLGHLAFGLFLVLSTGSVFALTFWILYDVLPDFVDRHSKEIAMRQVRRWIQKVNNSGLKLSVDKHGNLRAEYADGSVVDIGDDWAMSLHIKPRYYYFC
jgi:hypothetical protein